MQLYTSFEFSSLDKTYKVIWSDYNRQYFWGKIKCSLLYCNECTWWLVLDVALDDDDDDDVGGKIILISIVT